MLSWQIRVAPGREDQRADEQLQYAGSHEKLPQNKNVKKVPAMKVPTIS